MSKIIRISERADAVLNPIRKETLGTEDDPASYSQAIRYLQKQVDELKLKNK